MRILFNLTDCGAGNNGGTSTIFHSANTLFDLGHDVEIVDNGKNQHTWTNLKVPYNTIKHLKYFPSADVVISTGYRTVSSTVKLPDRCGLKLHWLRGWETWVMSEEQILNNVLKQPTIKFVNSLCLYSKLIKLGFSSYIVRPGYDLHLLNPLMNEKDSLIIGGLQCHKKHDSTKRTDWLIKTFEKLKPKYKLLQLWLFGNDQQRVPCSFYLRQPSIEQKNGFLNMIDVWMAPTMLEGLHIPPAEAMLTECPVVGTNVEMSGMSDYLFHQKTGLVSKNNLQSFIDCVEELLIDKNLRETLGKNGRSEIFKLGSRKYNMENMIKLLEALI